MARGRMVVTTVAIDKRLNALSLESQLLFLMTVPHLDRDGLIAGDAELLAGRVIPRRTELHERVNDLVQEWLDSSLAIAYDGPDTLILFFPGFRKSQLKMQYDREGASEFPPPPGYIRTASGLDPEPDKPTLALVQSNARPTLEEIPVKRKEVKDKEKEKGTEEEVKRADGKGTRPTRQSSSDLGLVCTGYEQMLGQTLTPGISDALWDWLTDDHYPPAWIVEAMQEAKKASRPDLRYVGGILKNWKAEGKNSDKRNGTGKHGEMTSTQIKAKYIPADYADVVQS